MALQKGDVLYFTGLVESLGQVCVDYGLMAVTSEQDSDGEETDNDPSHKVGPGRYSSPRRRSHFEPSALGFNERGEKHPFDPRTRGASWGTAHRRTSHVPAAG
jgi:hypothetical protein